MWKNYYIFQSWKILTWQIFFKSQKWFYKIKNGHRPYFRVKFNTLNQKYPLYLNVIAAIATAVRSKFLQAPNSL